MTDGELLVWQDIWLSPHLGITGVSISSCTDGGVETSSEAVTLICLADMGEKE